VGRYIEAALELQRLKDDGLVRHVGLTNFDARHTEELVAAGVHVASVQVGKRDGGGMIGLSVVIVSR
jgi:diketogulonate reductase-like aldo/keto reductase